MRLSAPIRCLVDQSTGPAPWRKLFPYRGPKAMRAVASMMNAAAAGNPVAADEAARAHLMPSRADVPRPSRKRKPTAAAAATEAASQAGAAVENAHAHPWVRQRHADAEIARRGRRGRR